MVINIGVIGYSEGNGHPFSFSAILNGYSNEGFRQSGWDVIYNYIRQRDPSEFGIMNARVSHVWTQDAEITKRISHACFIENCVSDLHEMIDQVDAVIIARDDHENHYEMAMPFLESGKHVFIDKPLTLDIEELRAFKPYLDNGQLMSCSGMRYAKELDSLRCNLDAYGSIKVIRGAVLNSWDKYGIHLIDAILSFYTKKPVEISCLDTNHESVSIRMEDDSLIQIDALGQTSKIFRIDIFATDRHGSFDITDNFSMFRRMLWHFVNQVATGKRALQTEDIMNTLKIMIAGKIALSERRKVKIDEIVV
jgi:Predicted dehydrogenases and related proteins